MNINITPSAVAVDTAANLLAFLEMAKDPSKLKAVLDQIKGAHAAAAAEADEARKAKADAEAANKAAQAAVADAQASLGKARDESAKAAAAMADAESMRESIKTERTKFDDWMAAQRESLSSAQAKVASDADLNAKHSADLDKRAAQVDAELAKAGTLQAAAEKLRAEYEQKIAALKSLV
jgi:chromosome segregation ATPase